MMMMIMMMITTTITLSYTYNTVWSELFIYLLFASVTSFTRDQSVLFHDRCTLVEAPNCSLLA